MIRVRAAEHEGRNAMRIPVSRRAMMGAAAMLLAAVAAPASFAQDKPVLRFSSVVSEQDIRADMVKMFGEEIKDDFVLEPYFGGTLFKQGTELVALQRGNLEMGNIAAQDIAKQIPAWSIFTAAYVFRDVDHMQRVFKSEIGQEMYARAEEQLGIHILGPVYFGARQVGLKPTTKISTPADMAGIKLRMPGGDAWQFLGEALGANPTPMAYAEVYTGLQTGAIDGQDNPLPNVENMKFYEVMSQIALTSHLVGFDMLCVASPVWNAMTPEQQNAFQAAADKVIDWSTQKHLQQESELVALFKEKGLDIYTPDVAAFRAYAQKKYLESDLAKDWPEGMLDKINAM
jgi:TRAP-type C4-dicarboxylate transport system substrate-binding protein